MGAKLPSEPELCEQHGVSRATVREAVRGLVEEGYLSRVHGSGTYVAFRPNIRHSLERNLSYSRLIEEAGFKPGRKVLTLDEDQPSEEETRRLALDATARVVRIERVRSADDRPVIYSIDAVPASLVAGTTRSDLGGSLYSLFASIGSPVAHGEATLAPTLADEEHREALGVEVGQPLLHIAQVDYTSAGDPVMYSREWHVPGIFELTLLRRPT